MAIKFVLFLFFLTVEAQSQECVRNLPIFEDQGRKGDVERLMSGTQTIIPDYSFDCNGTVTQWGAYVERARGNVRYTLDFQVWRKSGGQGTTTGEYDFVGCNHFQSIDPPLGGRIDISVPVEDQIKVRPGDVIGLYITTSGDNGVELKQQDTRNGDTPIIWFATSLTAALSTRIGVGSTNGYELMSTTTAVPVITAVVVPSTPPLSPTPPPLSPGLQKTVLATTSRPSLFPPDTTSSPVGSGLPVGSGVPGAIVAIVIVLLIVIVLGVLILVFTLAVALRRRSKKPPDNHSVLGSIAASVEMNTNEAYGTNTADIATTENVAHVTTDIATTENVAYVTTDIATTENVAYMTVEDTIPATQNVAYGQVPPRTDECYDYMSFNNNM